MLNKSSTKGIRRQKSKKTQRRSSETISAPAKALPAERLPSNTTSSRFHASAKMLFGFEKGGKHSVAMHPNGYPIASVETPPAILMEPLAKAFLNVENVRLNDVLQYKLIEPSQSKKLSLNSSGYFFGGLTFSSGTVSLANGLISVIRAQVPQRKLGSRRGNKEKSRDTRDPQVAPSVSKLLRMGRRRESSCSKGSHVSKNLNDATTSEPEEAVYHLSQLYDIQYHRLRPKEFTLVFNIEKSTSLHKTRVKAKFVELHVKADSEVKALTWLKHIFKATEQVQAYAKGLCDQFLENDRNNRVDLSSEKGQHQKMNCEAFFRVLVDLAIILYGHCSKETESAMQNLCDFIVEYGNSQEESQFWLHTVAELNELLLSPTKPREASPLDKVRKAFRSSDMI